MKKWKSFGRLRSAKILQTIGKVIWSIWPNNLISFEPLLRELHNQTDGIVYSTLLAIHEIVQKEIAELSCEWSGRWTNHAL